MTSSVVGDTLLIVATDPSDVDVTALMEAPPTLTRVLVLREAEAAAVRAALPWLGRIADAVVLLPPRHEETTHRRALGAASVRCVLP